MSAALLALVVSKASGVDDAIPDQHPGSRSRCSRRRGDRPRRGRCSRPGAGSACCSCSTCGSAYPRSSPTTWSGCSSGNVAARRPSAAMSCGRAARRTRSAPPRCRSDRSCSNGSPDSSLCRCSSSRASPSDRRCSSTRTRGSRCVIAVVTLALLALILFLAGHPRLAGRFAEREKLGPVHRRRAPGHRAHAARAATHLARAGDRAHLPGVADLDVRPDLPRPRSGRARCGRHRVRSGRADAPGAPDLVQRSRCARGRVGTVPALVRREQRAGRRGRPAVVGMHGRRQHARRAGVRDGKSPRIPKASKEHV